MSLVPTSSDEESMAGLRSSSLKMERMAAAVCCIDR